MQPAPTDHTRPLWQRALLVLIVILAALLVLALLRAHLAAAPPAFHATAYEPPDEAPQFTLTDHTGTQRSLADLRGHTVLLFFGYTNCPDVCPLTLTRLHEALEDAGAGPEDARVLLVTVDPRRDTPDVLARYVSRFGGTVTGLTGTAEELQAVYRAYGIHAEPGHDGAEPVHTSPVIGIDRKGQRRVVLRADAPREQLHADVETLLDL
jgi:protein SCO1/2